MQGGGGKTVISVHFHCAPKIALKTKLVNGGMHSHDLRKYKQMHRIQKR